MKNFIYIFLISQLWTIVVLPADWIMKTELEFVEISDSSDIEVDEDETEKNYLFRFSYNSNEHNNLPSSIELLNTKNVQNKYLVEITTPPPEFICWST